MTILGQNNIIGNDRLPALETHSFGDVLRKYKHAWSNTDDVPAKWEDIPNNIQKHNLESLGEWLTNVSGYVGLVRI